MATALQLPNIFQTSIKMTNLSVATGYGHTRFQELSCTILKLN